MRSLPIKCAIFLISTLLLLAPVGQRRVQEKVEEKLRKANETFILDKSCFVTEADVDNDGEIEIALGIMRYILPSWRQQIGYEVGRFIYLREKDPLPGNLILAIYKLRNGKWTLIKEITLLEKVYLDSFLDIKIGDFNDDKKLEVFATADGEQTYPACVYQIEKGKVKTLYEGPEDRAVAELRNIDDDPALEILEKAPTWHIATVEEQEGALKGHVLAIRVMKWDGRKQKWIFKKIVPDIEAERKLSREELFNEIGAQELLRGVPQSKLKEIYPSAFK